jgi:hypothetical protein
MQYCNLAASVGSANCPCPAHLHQSQNVSNRINSYCLQETRSSALHFGVLEDGLKREFMVLCIRVRFFPFASHNNWWLNFALKIKREFAFVLHMLAQLVESFKSASRDCRAWLWMLSVCWLFPSPAVLLQFLATFRKCQFLICIVIQFVGPNADCSTASVV